MVIAGADDISVQEYADLGYQIIIYATTPAVVVVRRDGRRVTLRLTPRYDAAVRRMRIGFAFDVRRSYPDPGQADAFQFSLDRLQALNLITWFREPRLIHVTASSEARAFCQVTSGLC